MTMQKLFCQTLISCIYGGCSYYCFSCKLIKRFCCWYQDIIHCHDWSSAPVAWLFKEQYMHYGLSKARIVFTIHNLEFGAELIGKAMASADKATTVSFWGPSVKKHFHTRLNKFWLRTIILPSKADCWAFLILYVPFAFSCRYHQLIPGKFLGIL